MPILLQQKNEQFHGDALELYAPPGPPQFKARTIQLEFVELVQGPGQSKFLQNCSAQLQMKLRQQLLEARIATQAVVERINAQKRHFVAGVTQGAFEIVQRQFIVS